MHQIRERGLHRQILGMEAGGRKTQMEKKRARNANRAGKKRHGANDYPNFWGPLKGKNGGANQRSSRRAKKSKEPQSLGHLTQPEAGRWDHGIFVKRNSRRLGWLVLEEKKRFRPKSKLGMESSETNGNQKVIGNIRRK